MVLLPEEAAMTLAELRQMAARQQHQIEAQQQLLVAKEQRLKFLKQQEARHHHNLTERQLDPGCLQSLRDKVESHEFKLRQLRALRGQVEQQKTNNGNLGAELDSIRALFSEKEKELIMAVSKVDELNRQLDEIKSDNNKKNCILSSTASELENLRRELKYQTKLSEQQNNYICQQRENIALRQQDISLLDQKLNELTQRLHRRRLLNEQLASQIHSASISRNLGGSMINNGLYHNPTIVAVEPLPREPLEPEHTQDDMSAKLGVSHQSDLGEFYLTKNDPKYQTLPYNTKFTLKGKCDESLSSSTEDDSLPNSLDYSLNSKRNPPLSVVKPSNINNLAPRPFNSFKSSNNSNFSKEDSRDKENSNDISLEVKESSNISKEIETQECNDSKNNNLSNSQLSHISTVKKLENPKPSNTRSVKPIVPPKPALPVKPMLISNRHKVLPMSEKISSEKDISAALSVLQNRSSEKDKNAIRFPGAKEKTDNSLTKSKIATYFPKNTTQSDGTSNSESRTESIDIEPPKRKSTLGQLPIKPKPLTIRKTPGLEPPKLKVQPINTSSYRKGAESQLLVSHFQNTITIPSLSFMSQPPEDTQTENSKFSDSKNVVDIPDVEIQESPEDSQPTLVEKPLPIADPPPANNDCSESTDEADFVKSGILSIKDESDEVFVADGEVVDDAYHLSAALRRVRKGNLKSETSVRNCRRVSFDPLALLLDAALEGELELVKKTAAEVPNPSAANDEGITALHNAICAGHIDVVTFLVEFGCDVNAQDSDGWTPLHCAASCNNLPMVKFLVERGACIFATTLSDHETAAEKCEEDEEGFDGCSEYLYSLQENLGVMNNGVVYAVYDYEVQNADELSFHDGDMLSVLRKGDDEESEWWWSRLSDEEGYVPRNLLGLYTRVTSKKLPKPNEE